MFVLVAGSASGASLGRTRGADLTVRSLSNPPASIERGATFRSALTVPNLGTRTARRSAPRLRQVDGGPRYYSRFSHALPSAPSYFPIGVWLECVNHRGNVMGQGRGLNVYVAVCGTGQSALNLARTNGMRVINEYDWPFAPGPGSETAGHASRGRTRHDKGSSGLCGDKAP